MVPFQNPIPFVTFHFLVLASEVISLASMELKPILHDSLLCVCGGVHVLIILSVLCITLFWYGKIKLCHKAMTRHTGYCTSHDIAIMHAPLYSSGIS